MSSYLQPLIGGSGGGGEGSSDVEHGNGGGGGGGAILISSSRDITVNGEIRADGGVGAGSGSGGAIRLVGDRVTINGNLFAQGENKGKIRIEGYIRNGLDHTQPAAIGSFPVPTQSFETNAALLITKVAGQNVNQPPTGSTLAPDVVFMEAGPISVSVQSVNVPNGASVNLRITVGTGTITKPGDGEPPVTLIGGTATFTNIIVPKGIGTIQASATFTLGNQ